MLLKFHNEEERQEAAARHAELYARARRGDITVAELERLSKALLKQYRKRKENFKGALMCAR